MNTRKGLPKIVKKQAKDQQKTIFPEEYKLLIIVTGDLKMIQ